MLKNIYDLPWDLNSRPPQHRLELLYPSPLPTVLSRHPLTPPPPQKKKKKRKKDSSNNTDIGIG